jgi:hypothetical protein
MNKEADFEIRQIMIIVAMFGLATGLLPKTSSAADVSVGLSFGVPFPAVVVYPAAPPLHQW